LSPPGYRCSVLISWGSGIQTLLPWWDKCFNVRSDYVEVRCVPAPAHVTRRH
jgi:hypothetical protein